ncbi:efflux RND transporter periplasmic adaptor subunit [Shewanella sp. NIFS-20-20]|uniref:efflux RND transporter periplasmic adaptor subunit n=1 Tax=Shewanella sp. NIFS-20-20 TaxID=2853806 RepID=UPI001C4834A0|nr:efflux RND transporter periplasmic adaptor subunit [Shewanella sp. NIFS-20-20]MBV7314997.1 efflux RND transporter periplasmic adaptor subunit [Shewanella sp. NIFS-20-20]
MKLRPTITAMCALLFSAHTLATQPMPEQLLTIESVMTAQMLNLDATLEAVQDATVSAQTSARILAINYDVNDLVPEGAELLRMTNIEQGAQLTGAEAELAKARAFNIDAQSQWRRLQQLFPQGAISKGEIDNATAKADAAAQAVNAAQSQVEKAIENVKYTQVFAPFSGILTARHVEVGETVQPGQALLSGYSNQQMRAVAWVPERYRQALNSLPKFDIELSDGRVIMDISPEISQFADPKSHSYMIRLPLPADIGNINPGSWAKVRFSTGQRQQIAIPVSAVYHMNELTAVYLWRNNQFLLTQVRLGAYQDDKVQVLAGLEVGDKIASAPYELLMSGKASMTVN